jgi:hypothetical protein
MAVDVDPARAVATRRAILERAAADRQAILIRISVMSESKAIEAVVSDRQ